MGIREPKTLAILTIAPWQNIELQNVGGAKWFFLTKAAVGAIIVLSDEPLYQPRPMEQHYT
jgi:hypothetical protein